MRPIEGFSNYRIGPQGIVYSIRGNEVRMLRSRNNRDGYPLVHIIDDAGRKHSKTVHRLVADAYLPPPPEKLQVNHKNGCKHDNRVANLEWSSAAANVQHAYATGLKWGKKGEDHPLAKLTPQQVLEIRASDATYTSLAAHYGVSVGLISLVARRKVWTHI